MESLILSKRDFHTTNNFLIWKHCELEIINGTLNLRNTICIQNDIDTHCKIKFCRFTSRNISVSDIV